jgi:hypothetical protein
VQRNDVIVRFSLRQRPLLGKSEDRAGSIAPVRGTSAVGQQRSSGSAFQIPNSGRCETPQ